MAIIKLNEHYDVCMCEPFILPGVLPTLGSPSLKSALQYAGISAKVFYPSYRFFVSQNIQSNKTILEAINNIPLQFSEFLFSSSCNSETIDYIINSIGLDYNDALEVFFCSLQDVAKNILYDLVETITNYSPSILCHSLTFGDYNFAFELFKAIKVNMPHIKIIVGGSNCDPQFSQTLLDSCPEIDYVICDETYETTINLCNSILNKETLSNFEHITDRVHLAKSTKKIDSLEDIPCPDYDDFFEEINRHSNKPKQIIVPYEVSRGCWWGEKKPCVMCGYFGNQKCFLIKSPQKVINEIRLLREKYSLLYIRLTDLVEPPRKYLKSLKQCGMDNKVNLFWELRPNVSEEDISLLRSFGLFYAQIGIESLSTDELKYINKGTTAINNISILINLHTYKIHCVWNYLYGFEDDRAEWYRDAISIMPKLYHLQPPDPRKVWINKSSEIYGKADKGKLKPIGNNVYYNNLCIGFNTFFETGVRSNMADVYEELLNAIHLWRNAFSKGYALYVSSDADGIIEIIREYDAIRKYSFSGIQRMLYIYFFTPHTLEQATNFFSIDCDIILKYLTYFVEENIMLALDNKYVALATRHSKYKWHNFSVLPNT